MPEIPRSENGAIWAPGTWTWIGNYLCLDATRNGVSEL